jgi:hypothetical protein
MSGGSEGKTTNKGGRYEKVSECCVSVFLCCVLSFCSIFFGPPPAENRLPRGVSNCRLVSIAYQLDTEVKERKKWISKYGTKKSMKENS